MYLFEDKLISFFFNRFCKFLHLTSSETELYAHSMTEFWDRLGISASLLCALHCLLTPALILLVPFLGETLTAHWFHIIIAGVVFPVAILALWSGYRRHHLRGVLILGGIGLTLMSIGIWFGWNSGGQHSHHAHGQLNGKEILFMVTAGVVLSCAHYINLRECRHCR